jgi:hypothetical protein
LAFYIKGRERLWIFENKILKRIFGPKVDEVRGDWRIM